MTKAVLRDAGPPGTVRHPPKNQEIKAWFDALLLAKVSIIPGCSGYEVRRNLLRAGIVQDVE